MLKMILGVGLMLLASNIAQAKLITGSYNITGHAETTLDTNGQVTLLRVHDINISHIVGEYANFIPTDPFSVNFGAIDPLTFNVGSLAFDRVVDLGGLVFAPISVTHNTTMFNSTSLSIIGNMSALGFENSLTEWYFSSQRLKVGETTLRTFSGFIESPPTSIPEPSIIMLLFMGGFLSVRTCLCRQGNT